jgi:hypothetical protein
MEGWIGDTSGARDNPCWWLPEIDQGREVQTIRFRASDICLYFDRIIGDTNVDHNGRPNKNANPRRVMRKTRNGVDSFLNKSHTRRPLFGSIVPSPLEFASLSYSD